MNLFHKVYFLLFDNGLRLYFSFALRQSCISEGFFTMRLKYNTDSFGFQLQGAISTTFPNVPKDQRWTFSLGIVLVFPVPLGLEEATFQVP